MVMGALLLFPVCYDFHLLPEVGCTPRMGHRAPTWPGLQRPSLGLDQSLDLG
jgi:hypothetical protein